MADGKGHKLKNADPKQLLYYALILHASGKKILGGGFLYWRHGYEPVDMSPKALYDFTKTDFEKGKRIFLRLKEGWTTSRVPHPPRTASSSPWKKSCTDSAYRIEGSEDKFTGIQEVGF